ncbi:MAG: hypothetical protein ACFCBW_22705 [Candidatus Competibacterales bacterium]
MADEPIKAVIEDKFDLGYQLKLADGSTAQLRVPEMKGSTLKHHIASSEEKLFGTTIAVYLLGGSGKTPAVSQFSQPERAAKRAAQDLKGAALAACQPGQRYRVRITRDYEWGYPCEQVDGHLEAVIPKPAPKLKVGEVLEAEVQQVFPDGVPFLAVQRGSRSDQ